MAVVTNFKTDLLITDYPLAFPLLVQFTDTSEGGPDTWFWDFGDNNFSRSQNPSHTYTSEGTFNITFYSWKDATINTHSLIIDEVRRKTLTSTTLSWDEMWDTIDSQPTTGSGSISLITSDSVGNSKHIEYAELDVGIDLTSVPNSVLNILEVHATTDFTVSSGLTGPAIDGSLTLGNNIIGINEMIAGDPVGTFGVSGFIFNSTLTDGAGFSRQWRDPVFDVSQDLIGYQSGDNSKIFTIRSHSNADLGLITKTISQDLDIDFVGVPLSGDDPLSVAFTDLSVINIKSSVWDFGDGSTVSFAGSTNPTHIYSIG